jgi:acetolactate synthase-1/2/3 large subunit
MTASTVTSGTVTNAQVTTVVERLASTMAELGMRDLFTLMGAGNLRLIHHLSVDHGIRIHHLRHENGAIGAADGYFRTTGEVGWCTVTQGPGFTNTITAVQTANRGRSAMVLITSDSSGMDERRFPFAGGVQGLDPELLLAPLRVTVNRMAAETADDDLRRAYTLAKAESKLVVLVIPTGLDLAPTAASTLAPPVKASPPLARDAQIEQIVTALSDADRPVLLAGRGAVESGAGPAIEAIAARTGAHLATTARAVGLFSGNPANLGIFGGFSPPEAAEIIEQANLIVAFGAALNLFQTRTGHFLEGATVIQIDADGSAFGRWDAPDLAVLGDAGDASRRILAAVTEQLPAGSRPIAHAPISPPFEDVSKPGEIDPRTLCRELDRVLPRPRRVFIDNGHFGSFPISHMNHVGPASLI